MTEICSQSWSLKGNTDTQASKHVHQAYEILLKTGFFSHYIHQQLWFQWLQNSVALRASYSPKSPSAPATCPVCSWMSVYFLNKQSWWSPYKLVLPSGIPGLYDLHVDWSNFCFIGVKKNRSKAWTFTRLKVIWLGSHIKK